MNSFNLDLELLYKRGRKCSIGIQQPKRQHIIQLLLLQPSWNFLRTAVVTTTFVKLSIDNCYYYNLRYQHEQSDQNHRKHTGNSRRIKKLQFGTMQILVKKIIYQFLSMIKKKPYINITMIWNPEVVVSLNLFVVCFVCEIS